MLSGTMYLFFFFNDTATTEIYTLSLHDALPISSPVERCAFIRPEIAAGKLRCHVMRRQTPAPTPEPRPQGGGRCVAWAPRGASKGCHQSVTSLSSNARQIPAQPRSGILNSFNAKRMLVVVAGVIAFAAAVAAVVAFAGAAQAADISGAGATFPYPVYSKWADAYRQKTGIGLNYQSIGSGGG